MRPASECAVSEVFQRIFGGSATLWYSAASPQTAMVRLSVARQTTKPDRLPHAALNHSMHTEYLIRPPGRSHGAIGILDAQTAEKFFIRVPDQFIAELHGLICIVCGGAIPPAVRERFDHIHEFLAGDTPPVQNQVMVG